MVGSTGKLASTSDLDTSLTFADVAGVDDAKSQVQVFDGVRFQVGVCLQWGRRGQGPGGGGGRMGD